MKTYPIKLSDALHHTLRLKAAQMGITLQELILTALQAIAQEVKP